MWRDSPSKPIPEVPALSHPSLPLFRSGSIYLHLDVADFVHRPDDWPADHRREDVGWEVAAGVATFHELQQQKYKLTQELSARGGGAEWDRKRPHPTVPPTETVLTPVPLSQTITCRPLLSIVVFFCFHSRCVWCVGDSLRPLGMLRLRILLAARSYYCTAQFTHANIYWPHCHLPFVPALSCLLAVSGWLIAE